MSFATVKAAADSPSLVRKILEAVSFIAPMSVAMPATITNTNGVLQPLPTGWVPLGIVSNEGYNREIDVEKEEVEGFGYATPVRTDITKAPSTLGVTPLEHGRKELLELFYGTNLDAVKQALNGEIAFDEPPLPVLDEYRLIKIGRDGTPDAEWLLADGFYRIKLASLPNDVWAQGDPFSHELSFDVLVDEESGSAVRHFIAGTAPKSAEMRTALGFTQAA